MVNHFEKILTNIDLILKSKEHKYNKASIEKIKKIVMALKITLEESDDIMLIDLNKVKYLSNAVYDLNYNNEFSEITECISNELYAFEFILQEELKRRKSNSEK